MRKKVLLVWVVLCITRVLFAEDWNTIITSGLFYYSEGTGTTEEEAGKKALENLLQMISVHVTNDFQALYDDEVNKGGQLSHEERVWQCVQTYSSVALANVQTMKVSCAPHCVVRKWMKCSELDKLYEERIGRLKNMVNQADAALERGNVDVALQYYYWAYALVLSMLFLFIGSR